MELKQLEPAEIVRDKYGSWMHPEYREYLDKHYNNQEWISQIECDELKRHFNIITTKFYLEASVSADIHEEMMNACDLSKWDPIVPHGFFLIDIGFTEDDAEAVFAKEIGKESEVA